MSSCFPLYLLDANNLHSTTALASLRYIWSRLASGWLKTVAAIRFRESAEDELTEFIVASAQTEGG